MALLESNSENWLSFVGESHFFFIILSHASETGSKTNDVTARLPGD